jgi:hypothetical protein
MLAVELTCLVALLVFALTLECLPLAALHAMLDLVACM